LPFSTATGKYPPIAPNTRATGSVREATSTATVATKAETAHTATNPPGRTSASPASRNSGCSRGVHSRRGAGAQKDDQTSSMQCRHPGKPRVERQQQVEALGPTHLADDDPGRPHPQRLPDEVAQRDHARPLETRLPRLHRDPVGMTEPQLEDLFGGDDPVASR